MADEAFARRSLPMVVRLLAISLVACGGSSTKQPAQTTAGDGSGGGGGGGVTVTSTDGTGAPANGGPVGGSTSSGAPGATSSGVDGSGGAGSGGANSGATGGGGAPGTSGGSSVGSAPGAGTEGGASAGSGAAGAGGSTADACAALVPTPGLAVEVTLSPGTHATCSLAMTNPDGEVALGIQGGAFTTEMAFRLYSPAGTSRDVDLGLLTPNSTDDIDPWFHWTSSGYAGLVHDVPPPIGVRTWSSSGSVLATTQDYGVSTAPDGHGGTLALLRRLDPGTAPLGPTRLVWMDPSGAVIRSVDPGGDPNVVLVSWGSGHVFVLSSGPDRARARWFDAAGAPLTDWFDAGAPFDAQSDATMHLLVDGSIVLGGGHGWRALFRDGAAAADAPPDWLAARPGTRLATIRQGRGYAVLPTVEAAGDATRLEIVTAAGESCGTVSLPPASPVPGVDKNATRVDVGQDGTVLQTETLIGADLGLGIHCGFRWWPALVR